MNRVRLGFALAACVLAALACGCGAKKPTSPTMPGTFATSPSAAVAQSAGSEFFPLALGNRWDYLYHFDVTGRDSSDPWAYSYRADIVARLVCTETHEGRAYRVLQRTWSDPNVTAEWIRYRQDRDGLYEWDEVLSAPAECKDIGAPAAARRAETSAWPAVAARLGPGANRAAWHAAWERLDVRRSTVATMARRLAGEGVAAGELQRLAYPLHPGQTWTIRSDPRFWVVVEKATSLVTPAGRFPCWSMRIFNEGLGPLDVVRTWYGRDGYLGYEALFYEVAADDMGQPVGTLDAVQGETLTGIALVGKPGTDR